MPLITSGAEFDNSSIAQFIDDGIASLSRHGIMSDAPLTLLTNQFIYYDTCFLRSVKDAPSAIQLPNHTNVASPPEQCMQLQLMVASMASLSGLSSLLSERNQLAVRTLLRRQARALRHNKRHSDRRLLLELGRRQLPGALSTYDDLVHGRLPRIFTERLVQAKANKKLMILADIRIVQDEIAQTLGNTAFWRRKLSEKFSARGRVASLPPTEGPRRGADLRRYDPGDLRS